MRVTYCSQKATAIFGWSNEDISLRPFDLLQFFPGDDSIAVTALLTEITSSHAKNNEFRNRNLTKDGRIICCQWYNSSLKDVSGRVISILSLCKDVTAQVQTQLVRQKSQQQHSLAFNSAIDPMWLIRVEGDNVFRFETVNVAFTNVTGWTPEQVEGQLIEKIMPAASHALVRQKYKEAITTGKIIDYIEEAEHPSGIKYGEIRVIPIWNQEGEPIRILGIANDITEKVNLQTKLEAEREKKSRQITSAAIRGQESERARVSRELHDNVNQVLTTVKLYIELCLDQKVDATSILPKCATLLSKTINEIRDLSRQLSVPTLGNMNFKESFADLLDPFRSSDEIVPSLHFMSLPFQELEIELHLALYRVAQEQLTNIIKYAKAKRVSITLSAESNVLSFIITDDGVGFDLTQKRKGIGITNMQSRVEMLNGCFNLTSQPGGGTKVAVEIPIIIESHVCYAEQTVLNMISN